MYCIQAFLPVGQGCRGSRQDGGTRPHGGDRVPRAWPGLDLPLPLPLFRPSGVAEDDEGDSVEVGVPAAIMGSNAY